MFDKIKENVANYKDTFNNLQLNAKEIRNNLLDNKYEFFIEPKHIIKPDYENDFSSVGVDSGFFSDNLTGIEFAYVKTAGSFINYKNGLIYDYKKIPDYAKKELYFSQNTQKEEAHKFVSIKRIIEEISLLTEAIKTHNPDIALIDGNVLPQAVDRPSDTSILKSEYNKMVMSFVKLYDTAKQNNTILVGCVEDTRATTFIEKCNIDLININDILLLDMILKARESTSFFNIFESSQNPIVKDLKEYGEFEFFANYNKTNSDYPLRIETISKRFDKIRNIIGFMSSHFKDYCFPSVLIDADKRAKLNKQEVDTIKNAIQSEFIKYNIKPFRRNRRI